MLKKIFPMVFIFFIPLFAPAQEKFEYLQINVFSNMFTNPFVPTNKKDTGMFRELFFDSVKNKPRIFERTYDILNLLGERGYELVDMIRIDNEMLYTFKRRKAS